MLEDILIKYFGLKYDQNKVHAYDKDDWYNAYDKLVSLIYDLGKIGVIDNTSEIVDKLDKIDREDF